MKNNKISPETEWLNPINPFNSMKVLRWWDYLVGCSKDDYSRGAVTVDVDPAGICNYSCIWCNAKEIMKKGQILSQKQLLRLPSIIEQLGARSACVAGGGEPTLNPYLEDFLLEMKDRGLETGLITNGSMMAKDEKLLETIVKCCKWIGVSVDAGIKKTYIKTKGKNAAKYFDSVIQLGERVRELQKEINHPEGQEITWKFLLHSENYHNILIAAVLAKHYKWHNFHLRPAGTENLPDVVKSQWNDEMINDVNEQIEIIWNNVAGDGFNFYGIRHKFDPTLSKGRKEFSRCWAIPILPTFGSDGYVHLCFDMRGREDLRMCKHEEILDFWNSEEHRKMVRSVDVSKCPRCTFSFYNEVIEKGILRDGFCINFP